jgi:outer membrane lipoprotein-sorting protein
MPHGLIFVRFPTLCGGIAQRGLPTCSREPRMLHRLLFGLSAIALASSQAHALSADELIARNAEARGGLDKIEAIHTLSMQGQLRFTGGFGSIDLGFMQIKKTPDLMRSEASVQGLTQVQVWNGKEAWRIDPFQGRKDAERMTDDDARALADDAGIAGPLVNYQARGSKVEYLGTEDVDGTEAHKLKVTLKNGDIQTVYLDPDHFIEIRIVSQRKVRGTEVEDITDFGDYEQIAGVYFPLSISSHTKGDDGKSQISIDKAEANPAVDDALFAFPAKAGSTP